MVGMTEEWASQASIGLHAAVRKGETPLWVLLGATISSSRNALLEKRMKASEYVTKTVTTPEKPGKPGDTPPKKNQQFKL